jgi:hypothetical protein
MATLSVVVAQIYNPKIGYKDPVPSAVALASAEITTSGTSQQTAFSTDGSTFGAFWVITATGGNVWVKFGANPTAAAGDQWLILDGQTRDFAVDAYAQKLAVIDA